MSNDVVLMLYPFSLEFRFEPKTTSKSACRSISGALGAANLRTRNVWISDSDGNLLEDNACVPKDAELHVEYDDIPFFEFHVPASWWIFNAGRSEHYKFSKLRAWLKPPTKPSEETQRFFVTRECAPGWITKKKRGVRYKSWKQGYLFAETKGRECKI